MPGRPRSLTRSSGRHSAAQAERSAAVAAGRTRAPCASRRGLEQHQRVGFVVDEQDVDAGERTAVTAARRRRRSADSCPRLRPSDALPASATSQAGSRTVKVAPSPCPGLAAAMVPPCSSTSCLQIARPRPSPPYCAAEAGVGLAERLEDVRQELRRDADPGVGDGDLDDAARRRASRTSTRPPSRVNLTALVSRFQNDLLQPRRVGGDAAGERIEVERDRRWRLASAAGPTRVERLADHRRRPGSAPGSRCTLPVVMRDMSSRSSTSWFCATALRSITSIACCHLSGGDHVGLQHPGVAEDRVERRPQLVRQRGEELVLQLVGRFGGVARRLERRLGPLPGGHVDADAVQRSRAAVRRIDGAAAAFHPAPFAVGVAEAEVDDVVGAGIDGVVDRLPERRPCRRRGPARRSASLVWPKPPGPSPTMCSSSGLHQTSLVVRSRDHAPIAPPRIASDSTSRLWRRASSASVRAADVGPRPALGVAFRRDVARQDQDAVGSRWT